MAFSYEEARHSLLDERAKLQDQLQLLSSAKHESVGYGNHMADDGTEAFEQAVEVSLSRNAGATLREVERALGKFQDGTYGLCEACGARIDRARLSALPHARLCLECQERREQEHSRVGSR
jgi:DnaK suppressor protein